VRVEKLGYRSWPRRSTPRALRWQPIARVGVASVLRRRLFWLFLGIGLISFLFQFAVVYFIVQIQTQVSQGGVSLPPAVRSAVFTGTGQSYRDFISVQSTVVMLFLGFAGTILVGNDFHRRALAFYLAKPVRKVDYFFGKLSAAIFLTALITLVPALILYVEFGSLTESLDYFRTSGRILAAIIGYGALVSVSSAILILGIAALFKRTIPILVAWGAIFIFLPGIAEICSSASDARPWQWDLLSFWDVQRWISNCFFGIEPDKYLERLPYALAVLAGWMVLGVWLFWSRVRAVEVVR